MIRVGPSIRLKLRISLRRKSSICIAAFRFESQEWNQRMLPCQRVIGESANRHARSAAGLDRCRRAAGLDWGRDMDRGRGAGP